MLEDILERIAVSLERLAFGAHPEGLPIAEMESKSPIVEGGSVFAGAPCAGPASGGAPPAEMSREEIKEALRAKGVLFKEAARTETLQKQLEDTTKGNHVAEREILRSIGMTPPSAGGSTPTTGTATASMDTSASTEGGTPVVTIDQVREAVIALSAAKGRDVALAIMTREGKAAKISEIDPSLYTKVLEACKKGAESEDDDLFK